MKKLVSILIVASLFVIPNFLYAETTGGTISATQTESDTVISGKNVYLRNDGANEVFIELNQRSDETDLTATTSSFELPVNGTITLRSDVQFSSISAICSAAETASLEYLAWD